MMRIRRVVLSILSSLEVYGETKRLPTVVGGWQPSSTQIQPRHVAGHRLNSDKEREFPEQAYQEAPIVRKGLANLR